MFRRVSIVAGKLLKKHPLIGNSSLYFILYSSSDLTQQYFLKKAKYDFTSTAHMAVMGSMVFAPFNYTWYKILDRFLVGTSLKTVCKKLICDQLIAGSIGIVLFYVGLAILENRDDKFSELKQKGVKTLLTSCVFWPCVQSINFFFLPNHLRTAYVGCAAFLWSNILCNFKHTPAHTTPEMEHEKSLSRI